MKTTISKSIKALSVIAVTCTLFAITAKAQIYLTGSGTANTLALNTSFYTSSQVEFDQTYFIGSVAGGLSSISGLEYGTLTTSATLLTGLSSTPKSFNIPDFFQFSGPQTTLPVGYQSSGTSPTDRFSFTLSSAQAIANNAFYGKGIVYDSANEYGPTPMAWTISFSGNSSTTGSNNSFSFAMLPVPEPGEYAMLSAGLAAVLLTCKRRRKEASVPLRV